MAFNRELSQFAAYLNLDAASNYIGITTSTATNVGIGKTNPTSKLEVVGDAKISGVVTATTFVGAVTGNASSATALQTARDFQVTGDANSTAISFDGTANVGLAVTLANTSVTPGSYGSSTAIPTFTVDSKGRLTAAGTASVGTALTVAGNAGSENINLLTETLSIVGAAGSVTTSAASNTITIDLETTSVSPGSYGSSTAIPTFTVDAKGRLTAAGTASVGTALTVAGDSGSENINLLSETLTIAGTAGVVTTSAASNTVTLNLVDTGVSAGSYGSSTAIPTFTVDAKGRLTAAGTASVGAALTVAGDSGTETINFLSENLTIAGGTNLTSSAAANTVTVNLDDNISLTSVVASGVVTAAQFVTGASGSAIGINTNTISGPATITLDPAGVGDNTGTVVIAGNLQVDGTTTTINSTTVTVDDKNIQIADGAINDAAADGAGFTVTSGDGNKTFQFEATGDNFGSSENMNLASGKVYKINNVEVLSGTTLGANVVNSSLTSVGTLTKLNVGNVNSTGIVTASGGFSGNLTGNVTGNLTGEVDAPAFDTNPNGVVVTGVATATSGFSGNLTGNVNGNINSTGVSTIANLNTTNINASGIVTASTGAVIDGVQIGINGANVIDTVSGNLTLNSAGGQTIIDDVVTIQNNLNVNGNVTIGGTTVTLISQDVFISNKDIVLGYTTATSPNDDSANHAGVAIASTVGTPLVSFSASGINTLPDTYKQMMWFKNGTLGFSTDAFGFNYGVAIGTTTMASGVRLAVGSGITMSDTAIKATNFYGSLDGSISGNAATATALQTARDFQVTGDASSTAISFNGTANVGLAVTLANTGVVAGSYGSSTAIPTFTVDSKGRLTAAGTASVGAALTVVGDSGTETINFLNENLTIAGTAGIITTSAASNTVTLNLVDSGVTAGSYGSSTAIPTFTVDSKGRLTAAGTASVGTALTVAGDSGSENINLLSETLTISGGTNLTSSAASNAVTINLDDNISLTSVVASGVITAAQFVTGASGSAIGINTNTISGPSQITIDPAGVGDNTGLVVIKGDLQIDGTTTTVNSTTVTVDDKNLLLASGAVNDAAADGGGITIESGDGNKTWNWVDSTDSWTSSEHINVASGKVYKVNGTEVLSSNTLGSGVVNSSLTSVGTLTQLNVGNVNSTGIVTASGGFSGNVTGNVTGDLTGEVNSPAFDTNASGVVVTGVATATSGFSGNLTGNVTGNLTGNVTGNINSSGMSTVTNLTVDGYVSIGNTYGQMNQVFASVGAGVTWKNFADLLPQTRTTQTFTATGGQTSFNFTYNVNYLDVYVNGVKLSSTEFTATNGTSITLSEAAFAGDIVEFISYSTAGAGSGSVNSLNDLTDVTLSANASGNVLAYNGSGWVNTSDLNVGVVTASSFVGGLTGNASTATALQTARNFQVTGDAASTTISFNGTANVGLAVTLADTAVTPGSYGSATQIPTFTVDSKGRLTAAGTASVGAALTVTGDSGSEVINFLTESLAISGGTNLTSSAAANAVTINLDDNISLTSVVTSGIVTASAFHTGASGSAIRVTSDTISGPATITLDPAGVGDNTGTVVIKGDLQVDGTTTTINSTTMTVDDLNITLASGAANAAAANGAGVTIDGASATLTYANNGDKWVFNKDVESPNFNSTSDRNLKDNIRQVEGASELVSKLEGVHFTWKENGKETIGVIAQQIEEHLPQLVQTGETHKTVNYNGLIGVLIEAVKEQGAQIAALQAEIEELKK